MKSNFKLFSAVLIAFVFGMAINNIAFSDEQPVGFKLAIVDVAKVVDTSKSVDTLKNEQRTKIKELMSFVENARAEVAKQKDAKAKKTLEEKYNKELNVKKDAIEADYTKKLDAINKNITASIADIAKTNNYNVVLAKSTVLYGGDDITPDVIKVVK